jgi:hypothetical protein
VNALAQVRGWQRERKRELGAGVGCVGSHVVPVCVRACESASKLRRTCEAIDELMGKAARCRMWMNVPTSFVQFYGYD